MDIVERLREYETWSEDWPIIKEAADEIERLREELKKPILVGKKQIEALPNSDSYWVYPIRDAQREMSDD